MHDFVFWLSSWYNLVFLLPLITGFLFVTVDLAMGGLVDADLDLDVDADADVDVDVDVESDADISGAVLLSWLGVGKVPITLLLEVMAISFGGVGLLANGVARDLVGRPEWTFPLALVAAAVGAVLVARWVGVTLARWMPNGASTSLKPADFVGQIGTAASRVSQTIGQVRLAGSTTRPMTLLNARCADAAGADIPRGMAVLVVGYDADKNVYAVSPTDLEVK